MVRNIYHIYFFIPSLSIRFSKYSIKHLSLTRYNLPTEQGLKLFSAACKFPFLSLLAYRLSLATKNPPILFEHLGCLQG